MWFRVKKKAVGIDGIPSRILKLSAKVIGTISNNNI